MPELPDVELYCTALRERVLDQVVRGVTVRSPQLLRTVEPPVETLVGRRVERVRRLGKRIVFECAGGCCAVLHLMIAGRLRWNPAARGASQKIPARAAMRAEAARRFPRIVSASFEFDVGRLWVTEAGTQKRAALHVLESPHDAQRLHAGGGEPLAAAHAEIRASLRRENRTLKRALTDPRIISGVGNAYSDEILHAARLSPVQRTQQLADGDVERLCTALRRTLQRWIERLHRDFAGRFPGPGDVTAFRPDFAVHGRYGLPCPDCGAPVQRIRYADNETNYCPGCQTGGRILADRSLSRLLREDWPRTLDELE